MISNLHRNCMGTVSFDGKFQGMRKPQDFIIYPLHVGHDASRIKIQSSTRIGHIDLNNGNVDLRPPRSGGAYFNHLGLTARVGKLPTDQLLLLKARIMDSASGRAGSNGIIYTDNSEALNVFGEAV